MSYFDRAMIVLTLVGALSGLVGTFVVLRRRVLFAQALTHATFPGAVIAAIAGINIQIGAAVASLVLVGVLALLGRVQGQGVQAASGVMLTAGFALGVLLQALNPNIPINIESFLFGSVLASSWTDALFAAIALAITVVVLLIAGKQLIFAVFDPRGYRAAGFSETAMDVLLLLLTTLTVIAALPAVGAILAISLIAAPPAAARLLTSKATTMLFVAPALGVASGLLGLTISRVWAVSAGASVALVAAGIFLIALGINRVRLGARA
ncbi:MAG: manganese/iron transport system permease protein [Alpinimonas sp.]|jgi:zinc/manganese transport system permease protein